MGTWTWGDAAMACVLVGAAGPACGFGGGSAGNGQATLAQETVEGGTLDPPGVSSGPTETSDTTEGSASDSAQPPSTEGGATCQSSCTPLPPAGWDGPQRFASAPSDNPIPCPIGYEEAAVGFRGLNAPAAECDCSCKADGGGCAMDCDFFTFENCSIPLGPSGDVLPNACESLAISEALSGFVRGQINAQAGSCEPESNSTVAPPLWESSHTLCTPPPLLGDCGDEVCVPLAPSDFDEGLCITAAGEVNCPEGPYTERTVLYQGLLDDRSCSTCSCSVAAPPPCDGMLEIYQENSCAGTPQPLPADGSCYAANVSGSFGLRFGATVGETACDASGGSAQGEAARTNALTVCCAE